jgi:hypothetical protein
MNGGICFAWNMREESTMKEMLLAVFDETLDDLVRRMKVTQGNIARFREEVEVWQKDVVSEDDRWKCALYEEEQITKKIDVLRDYLRRLGKQPDALLNKAKSLGEEQKSKTQAAEAVKARVENIRYELQTRQTKLAVQERECANLQRQ